MAGVVLHMTHTALHSWFWAAYLMSTATTGISARQLQRQLGLTRHQMAWTMLHKLRRAMVNPERCLLTGEVDVDECQVGGRETGRRDGTNFTAEAAKVVVAVEHRGQGSGRVPMKVIADASGDTLTEFITDTVGPGAIVHTDGWLGYAPLAKKDYDYRHGHKGPPRETATQTRSCLEYIVRSATSRRGCEGHRSVSNEQLQVYLDELTFRYNRRSTPMAAFQIDPRPGG